MISSKAGLVCLVFLLFHGFVTSQGSVGRGVVTRILNVFDTFLQSLQRADTRNCVQRVVCGVGANRTGYGAFGKRIVNYFGYSPSSEAITKWSLPEEASNASSRSFAPTTYLGMRAGSGYVILAKEGAFVKVVDMRINKTSVSAYQRGFFDSIFNLTSVLPATLFPLTFNFTKIVSQPAADLMNMTGAAVDVVKPLFVAPPTMTPSEVDEAPQLVNVTKPAFNFTKTFSELAQPAMDAAVPALNLSKSAFDFFASTFNVSRVPINVARPVFNVSENVIDVGQPVFNLAPKFNVTEVVVNVPKPVFNITNNVIHVEKPVLHVAQPEFVYTDTYINVQKPVLNVTKYNVTLPPLNVVVPRVNFTEKIISLQVPVFNFTKTEKQISTNTYEMEMPNSALDIVKPDFNTSKTFAIEKPSLSFNKTVVLELSSGSPSSDNSKAVAVQTEIDAEQDTTKTGTSKPAMEWLKPPFNVSQNIHIETPSFELDEEALVKDNEISEVEGRQSYIALQVYNRAYQIGDSGGEEACSQAYPKCTMSMDDVVAFTTSLFPTSE